MTTPFPEPVKTGKRCKFSLPGVKYNCRAIGKYPLHGKGYCAPHFRATWAAQNPVFGQQHDWHVRRNHITDELYPYPTCRICGCIKHREGLAQDPCQGSMPLITLRAASFNGDEVDSTD